MLLPFVTPFTTFCFIVPRKMFCNMLYVKIMSIAYCQYSVLYYLGENTSAHFQVIRLQYKTFA